MCAVPPPVLLIDNCIGVAYRLGSPCVGLTFEGIVFDKTVKEDGNITYMVFLEKLKILSKLKCHVELDNYSKRNFKIYFSKMNIVAKRKYDCIYAYKPLNILSIWLFE